MPDNFDLDEDRPDLILDCMGKTITWLNEDGSFSKVVSPADSFQIPMVNAGTEHEMMSKVVELEKLVGKAQGFVVQDDDGNFGMAAVHA